MIVKITIKNSKIGGRRAELLTKKIEQLSKQLPDIDKQLVILDIVLFKQRAFYPIKRDYHHVSSTFTDKGFILSGYEGLFNLRLPRKILHVRSHGTTTIDCINSGMVRLKKELQKYKDLHFKSRSRYFDHRSIRKELSL